MIFVIKQRIIFCIIIYCIILINPIFSKSINQKIEKFDFNNNQELDPIILIESFNPQKHSLGSYQKISNIHNYKGKLYLINHLKKSIARLNNKEIDNKFSEKFKNTLEKIEIKIKKKISRNQWELKININDGYIFLVIVFTDSKGFIRELVISKLTMDLEFVYDFYEQGILKVDFKKEKYLNQSILDLDVLVIDNQNNVYLSVRSKKEESRKIVKISNDSNRKGISIEDVASNLPDYLYTSVFLDDDKIFYSSDGIYLVDKDNRLLYVDFRAKNSKVVENLSLKNYRLHRLYLDHQDLLAIYTDYSNRYLYIKKITKDPIVDKKQVLNLNIKIQENDISSILNVSIRKVLIYNKKIYVLYYLYSDRELYPYLLIIDSNGKEERKLLLSSIIISDSDELKESIYIPRDISVDQQSIFIAGICLKERIFELNFISKINIERKNLNPEYTLILENVFESFEKDYDDFSVKEFVKLESGYLLAISKNNIDYLVRLKDDFSVDLSFADKGIFTFNWVKIIGDINYNYEREYYSIENYISSIQEDELGNIFISGLIKVSDKKFYYLLKINKKGEIDKIFNNSGFISLNHIFKRDEKLFSDNSYKILLKDQKIYVLHTPYDYKIRGTKLNAIAVLSSVTAKISSIEYISDNTIPFSYTSVGGAKILSNNILVTLNNTKEKRIYIIKIDGSGKLVKNFGKKGFIVFNNLSYLYYLEKNIDLFIIGKYYQKNKSLLYITKIDENGNIDNIPGLINVDNLGNIINRFLGIQNIYVTSFSHGFNKNISLIVELHELLFPKNKYYVVDIDYSNSKNKKVKFENLIKFEKKIKKIAKNKYNIKIDYVEYIVFFDKSGKRKIICIARYYTSFKTYKIMLVGLN
ncbi:MAG: hypothetical protein RMJ67_08605 [Elusimicrobiota bacterium]|nr:hypothetical protein [Endomicrobiia bacterium]MDW8166556.1 hypothetical protein [Elusimicrobiota bacterium]